MLSDIAVQAVEGLRASAGGGHEVGGVLFGQHDNGVVRILAFRTLTLTPVRPAFVFARGDDRLLSKLIEDSSTDPALEGLRPVGWYHSHTRSEIFLSKGDVEIHDRHFPELWQIALVLRPRHQGLPRFGFFYREPDGGIETQCRQEFVVDSEEYPQAMPQPPAGVDSPQLTPPIGGSELAPAAHVKMLKWKQIVKYSLAALFLLLAAIGQRQLSSRREMALGLYVRPTAAGKLAIHWNGRGPGLEEASSAMLLIQDDAVVQVPLNRSQFIAGRYDHKLRSNLVKVRLKVNVSFGRNDQAVALYLAHPDLYNRLSEVWIVEDQQNRALQEVLTMRTRLLESEKAAERFQTDIDQLEHRLRSLPASPNQSPENAALPAVKSAEPKELPAPPEVAIPRTVPALPLSMPPVALQPSPPPTASSSEPPIEGRRSAAVALNAAYAGPASGRIIWIGKLASGGVLTIDGFHPSKGAVNAELPGVPVSVSAYPAELTNAGLRVMIDSQSATFATEPPGPANGYTKVQFVHSPTATRDVIVEQTPGVGHSKRLVLRAGARSLTAVVINWRVIR